MEIELPTMRDLAQRSLTGFMSAHSPTSVTPAIMMTDSLKAVLVRFAGSEGFASLMHRALLLRSGDTPLLQPVNTVGDLEAEPALAVTVKLLDLLVALVGRVLTLRLMHEAWPHISLSKLDTSGDAHSKVPR